MANKKVSASERIRKINSYQLKYTKKHYNSYLLKFNKESEADVIEWLEAQPNKKGAVLELIRQAIEADK